MRRTPAAICVASLVVCALALVGCSSWFESTAKSANDVIATVNEHLESAMTVGGSVADAAARLDAIPYTTEGAADAKELTAQMRSELVLQKEELEAAKAAMDSAESLEVSDEFKAYAKLESTALGTRMRVVDLGTDLYTEMEKLYSALSNGKSGASDTQKIMANIETIKRDITAVSELAAQQSKAASDYFAAQKLGG